LKCLTFNTMTKNKIFHICIKLISLQTRLNNHQYQLSSYTNSPTMPILLIKTGADLVVKASAS